MADALVGVVGSGELARGLAANLAGHGYEIAAAEIPAPESRPRVVFLLDDNGDAAIVEGGAHVLSCGLVHDAATLRHGPAYVIGGNHDAYLRVRAILRATAAREQDVPCVAYAGVGAAGHAAQRVHDHLAATDVRLAAEAYELIVTGLGRTPAEAGEIFADWNTGELRSALMTAAAQVLERPDGRTFADALAATLPLRSVAHFAEAPRPPAGELKVAVPDIFEAVYAARIIGYARGFERLPVEHRAEIASAWRAGSALAGRFLTYVREAYEAGSEPATMVDDLYFAGVLRDYRPTWRRVVDEAERAGLAVPTLRSLERGRVPGSDGDVSTRS